MGLQWTLRSGHSHQGREPWWLSVGPIVVMVWVIALACAAARGQSTELWNPPTPPSLSGQAMAYDSARHVMVLFGRIGSTGTVGETWEWDGVEWTQRYSGGPPARSNHSMAYDSLRGVTVLFGGDSAFANLTGNKLNDTWEWNGSTWRQVASTGPLQRSRSPMVFDSLRGVMVLFSGEVWGSNRPADTWEWDGTSWAQRQPALSPPGTHSHSMSYDSVRNVTVLTGGLWTNGTTSGTWEWDGSNWTRRSSITDTSSVQMVFDSVRHVSIRNGQKWNGTAWSSLLSSAPRPAFTVWTGSMAFDSAQGVLVLLGTRTAPDGTSIVTETWEWDGTSWMLRTPLSPGNRFDHAMAFDRGRGAAVLWGGVDSTTGVFHNDTWERSGGVWVQRSLDGPDGPPAVRGTAMAYDTARGVTTMFGGRDAQGVGMNQTWEWNGAAWTNRGVPGPDARAWAGMAYDSTRAVTVMYGGRSDLDGAIGETWEWNGTTWSLRATGGPGPRSQHVIVYDSTRRVVLMHGGINLFGFSTRFADTWTWDGNAWTRLATAGPSERYGSSMAFDSGRGVAVLNGGRGAAATPFGDTWEWNGSQWTQTGVVTTSFGVTSAPGVRTDAAMVYDDVRRELMMFGGTPTNATSDTWLYHTECVAPAFTPAATQVVRACLGSTVTLSAAPSGTDVSYLWFKGGAGLGSGPTGAGSTVGGSSTSTLLIANAGGADTGSYFLRAANTCGIADSPAFSVRVCAADYNCSGTVTLDDVFDYVNGWLNGDALADMDGNGLSVQDIFTFINTWFTARTTLGCQ